MPPFSFVGSEGAVSLIDNKLQYYLVNDLEKVSLARNDPMPHCKQSYPRSFDESGPDTCGDNAIGFGGMRREKTVAVETANSLRMRLSS